MIRSLSAPDCKRTMELPKEQMKEISYLMPAEHASWTYSEKRSVFIGRVFPVSSDDEAIGIVESVRKDDPDARHNVYGYRLFGDVLREKFSDDGEPKGTGGRPCLDVLQKNNVHNALIVVTRYFGGILLGAPGLTRAYSKAAAGALSQTELLKMTLCREYEVSLSYDQYGRLTRLLDGKNVKTEPPVFASDVSVKLKVPVADSERLEKDIVDMTSSVCRIVFLGNGFYHIES